MPVNGKDFKIHTLDLKLRDLEDYDLRTEICIDIVPLTDDDSKIYGIKYPYNARKLLIQIVRNARKVKGFRIIFNNTEEDIIVEEAKKLRDDLIKRL